MSNQTEYRIKRRIREQGRLTFAELMELALYSRGGFYDSGTPIGARGDYYTSPSTHCAFGALIALQIEEMWRALGSPSPFWVIEPGAGDGTLARDLTGFSKALDPGFAKALRYVSVERRRHTEGQRNFNWLRGADWPFDGITGCIVSNELVDALPVHRVAMLGGRLQERYVTLDDGHVEEVLDEPSTPELAERLEEDGARLEEGWEGEVGLDAARWMEKVAGSLQRGYVITIDYGDMSDRLYSIERSRGTVTAYYRHTQQSDIYARLGRQDITSHANFSTLIETGRRCGLQPVVLMTQREFLQNLGIDLLMEATTWDTSGRDDSIRRGRQGNLLALRELINPDGLGAFRVLVQVKNAPASELACLGRGDHLSAVKRRLPSLPLPWRDNDHIDLAAGRYPHTAWEDVHIS